MPSILVPVSKDQKEYFKKKCKENQRSQAGAARYSLIQAGYLKDNDDRN